MFTCNYISSLFFTRSDKVSSWLLVLRTSYYNSSCIISIFSCMWPTYYWSSPALISASSLLPSASSHLCWRWLFSSTIWETKAYLLFSWRTLLLIYLFKFSTSVFSIPVVSDFTFSSSVINSFSLPVINYFAFAMNSSLSLMRASFSRLSCSIFATYYLTSSMKVDF